MDIIQQLGKLTNMNYQQALQDGYSPYEVIQELLRRYYASEHDTTLDELIIKKAISEKIPFPKDTTPETQSSPATKQVPNSFTVKFGGKTMTLIKDGEQFVLKPEPVSVEVKEPATEPIYKRGEPVRVFANDRFNN